MEQAIRHLPVFWEPGGDEITPTVKLIRVPIAAKYADVIESPYAEAGGPLQLGGAGWPGAG